VYSCEVILIYLKIDNIYALRDMDMVYIIIRRAEYMNIDVLQIVRNYEVEKCNEKIIDIENSDFSCATFHDVARLYRDG